MNGEWCKLYVESALTSWTSNLPNDLFGVWCKTLLIVKGFGRNGTIRYDRYVTLLARAGVSVTEITNLLAASQRRVISNDGNITIRNWLEYQGDQANRERQKRFRQNHRNARNVSVTRCNEEQNRVEENRIDESEEAATPSPQNLDPLSWTEKPKPLVACPPDPLWDALLIAMPHLHPDIDRGALNAALRDIRIRQPDATADDIRIRVANMRLHYADLGAAAVTPSALARGWMTFEHPPAGKGDEQAKRQAEFEALKAKIGR